MCLPVGPEVHIGCLPPFLYLRFWRQSLTEPGVDWFLDGLASELHTPGLYLASELHTPRLYLASVSQAQLLHPDLLFFPWVWELN